MPALHAKGPPDSQSVDRPIPLVAKA